MARDYHNDVDWKNSYTTERVALGLVGGAGFRSSAVIRYVMKKMDYIETRKGLPPGKATFKARMDFSARCKKELQIYEAKKPRQFKKGRILADAIIDHLQEKGHKASTRVRRWRKKPEPKTIKRSNGK
jgi:hypothetical protein